MDHDDIPELTGAKRDAIRAQSQDAGLFVLGYATGLQQRMAMLNAEDVRVVGRMLHAAVEGLMEIANRPDCACPEKARRVLLRMAEKIE